MGGDLIDLRAAAKTNISTYLIGRYKSQSRAPLDSKKVPKGSISISISLPEFQNIRRRREYYYKEGIDLKAYVKYTECGIFLCLIKERNCFKMHHL